MNNNNIGKNIKNYRLLKGWTQDQLANKSGLSKNAIYNYENGKRSPNIKIIYQIADALEIEHDKILDSKESDYLDLEIFNNIYTNNKSYQKDVLIKKLYLESQKLNNNELEAIINIINIFNNKKEED